MRAGVGLGLARTADGSTEGPPSLLFSREQVWSGGSRQVLLMRGWARLAEALRVWVTPNPLNFAY